MFLKKFNYSHLIYKYQNILKNLIFDKFDRTVLSTNARRLFKIFKNGKIIEKKAKYKKR